MVETNSGASLRWDGGPDEKVASGQFMREINIKIEDKNYTTDTKKIECFRNNLDYEGTADLWFDDLDAGSKDTWVHLVNAFEIRWPKATVPKASKSERIRALKEWVVKPDELGKKTESAGGKEVWSHIKWANGLNAKVRDANDTGGLLLQDVFESLPAPLRDLVRHKTRTTYDELADAVRDVDVLDLKETVSKHAKDEETARLARILASPTKAIRESMANTHLQYPQRPYPNPPYMTPRASAPDPFNGGGGRGSIPFSSTRAATFAPIRGNGPGGLGFGRGSRGTTGRVMAQGPSLRDRPVGERFNDLQRFALPHNPDTEAGRAAYQAQVADWHRTNPNGRPDEQRPYPLTPGTAVVGSRECWDCGHVGHMQGPACQGGGLPEPEREWRRIASFITRQYNKERLVAQHVNYIGYQYNPYPQYEPYPNTNRQYRNQSYLEEIDDESGNGGGPSA